MYGPRNPVEPRIAITFCSAIVAIRLERDSSRKVVSLRILNLPFNTRANVGLVKRELDS
jgi:hypothetical protein